MRWLFAFLFAAWLLVLPAIAAEGEVCKVLPQFLDLKGDATVSPSLFDRDAYQSMLRHNPGKRGGFRFCVQWKVKSPDTGKLKLRVEIRGTPLDRAPKVATVEMPVKRHWFSHWDYFILSKEEYKTYGEVTAWRATLWDGDKQLGEQKSLLW